MVNEMHDQSQSNLVLAFVVILSIITALFLGTQMMSAIDSRVKSQNHDNFISGVRYGTRAYSKQYRMDTENLKNISEGYILKEDIDKYALASNPVEVDRDLASQMFLRILSGNTNIPIAELKNDKIYMIHVYTVYQPGAGNKLVPKYIAQVFKIDGTPVYTPYMTNNLLELQQWVEGTLKINVDINNSINESIHAQQEYDRRGQTGNSLPTYSTYNTYMCIGVDVPLKNRFSESTISFSEIQTYSTMR